MATNHGVNAEFERGWFQSNWTLAWLGRPRKIEMVPLEEWNRTETCTDGTYGGYVVLYGITVALCRSLACGRSHGNPNNRTGPWLCVCVRARASPMCLFPLAHRPSLPHTDRVFRAKAGWRF